MEDRKTDSGNGASDAGGYDWRTGEQGVSKYVRPATMPEVAAVDAEKVLKQPTSEDLVNIQPVKRLGSIEVRKPTKQEWFRSHPTMFA